MGPLFYFKILICKHIESKRHRSWGKQVFMVLCTISLVVKQVVVVSRLTYLDIWPSRTRPPAQVGFQTRRPINQQDQNAISSCRQQTERRNKVPSQTKELAVVVLKKLTEYITRLHPNVVETEQQHVKNICFKKTNNQTNISTPTPSDLIKNFGTPRSVMLPILCCCLAAQPGVAYRDAWTYPANQMRPLPNNFPNRAIHPDGGGGRSRCCGVYLE